jgi:SET domain-containing protein|tara:strand:+ start:4246 stop:4587 length:342 start_codon:yes stop_codon:yes gene_type:complete
MYKPLPKEVIIKQSPIEGLGLFSNMEIKEGHIFGVTHISDIRFKNGYIRTPLGGFINHSKEPNCILTPKDKKTFPISENGSILMLVSLKDIPEGTEITTKYSLYNFKENTNET